MTEPSPQSAASPAAGDERAASAGGTAAPPAPEAANLAPAGLTRRYEGAGIRVGWYASRCIHSAACIRALPSVFDPKARPWIDLAAPGVEADAVAAAVLRCPTGALHYERLDGGPPEPRPGELRITAMRDGPYILSGEVEIRDEAGALVRADTRIALCRCGQSRHAPFCDNTHRAIGFRSAPPPASRGTA